jgi:hypothetical protein
VEHAALDRRQHLGGQPEQPHARRAIPRRPVPVQLRHAGLRQHVEPQPHVIAVRELAHRDHVAVDRQLEGRLDLQIGVLPRHEPLGVALEQVEAPDEARSISSPVSTLTSGTLNGCSTATTLREEFQSTEATLAGLRSKLAEIETRLPPVPPEVDASYVGCRLTALDKLLRLEPIRAKAEVAKHLEELTIAPLPAPERRRRGEKRAEIRGQVKTDGLLRDQEAVVAAVHWLRGLALDVTHPQPLSPSLSSSSGASCSEPQSGFGQGQRATDALRRTSSRTPRHGYRYWSSSGSADSARTRKALHRLVEVDSRFLDRRALTRFARSGHGRSTSALVLRRYWQLSVSC